MSSFLSSVVQTLPRLAAISFSYSPDGLASCGFLKADPTRIRLDSAEKPLAARDVQTFLIETSQPCMVSIEAATWPPPRCIDYRATILGQFFPFEGNGRLPYSTPGNGQAETKQVVTFDSDGRLTLASYSSTQSHALSNYAVDTTMRVFVCIRSAKAGDVNVTHFASGEKADEI